MNITLTLSRITPLDFAFNTPSPPPIVSHLISFNLLDVHGATCLCCLWYQIFTKRQKQSQTGQNRALERKEREEKSKSEPKVKKSTGSKSSQSQP
ncbi:hypothetical protein Tco_0899775 [Tanacetum coccineum]